MNFIHYELDLGTDDQVEVNLDNKANVKLLDPPNYEKYCGGEKYAYFGGYATQPVTTLKAPAAGHWHLVIDLGGYPGSVEAGVRKLKSVG